MGYLVVGAVVTEIWNTGEEMILVEWPASLTNCIENGKGTLVSISAWLQKESLQEKKLYLILKLLPNFVWLS